MTREQKEKSVLRKKEIMKYPLYVWGPMYKKVVLSKSNSFRGQDMQA